MRLPIISALIVLLLSGAGIFSYSFFIPAPYEVAVTYLTHLEEQRFRALSDYHHEEYPSPEIAELEESFSAFASAFGLTEIVVGNLSVIEESLFRAIYQFELQYLSPYFKPLIIPVTLPLSREGLFDWKVEWTNNLPLPDYGLEATYNRSRIEPDRGSIYDRNGNLLAGQGSVITIGVQPGRIEDPDQLHQLLQDTLGLNPDYVQRQYQAPGVQDHWFVPLTTVSEQIYLEVDPLLRPVPGIFFRRQASRVYPAHTAMGHITGYLGEVSSELIAQYPTRDYRSAERVGRSGLESGEEELLRGQPGYRFIVVPPSKAQKVLAEIPVVHGQDIHLTIDLKMQEIAEQVLSGKTSSLVVLDATNGEILVLISLPGYDPNEFSIGISHERWQQLTTDPNRPMFNRALQGRYPPGSVFKVVTAASALDQGLFQPDSIFRDSGEFVVQGNVIRNFEREIFAEHSLEKAIVKSINTTMAQVGLELGAQKLTEYFSRWQLDNQPSFSLPASTSQIGNPTRSSVGLAWTAIGQDQVLLTPFAMASLFTVFTQEGMLPQFHLIQGRSGGERHEVLQPDTAHEMAEMLEKVVLEGTGRTAAVNELKVIGKTGTAETANSPTHAWFAGSVEYVDGRELAFALLFEEGGVGGRNAAPLIAEFFSQLMND